MDKLGEGLLMAWKIWQSGYDEGRRITSQMVKRDMKRDEWVNRTVLKYMKEHQLI